MTSPEKKLKSAQPRLRHEWIASLFLVLSIVCVYHPVTSFEFVLFDDDHYVVENPHIQTGLTVSSVAWAFTTTRGSNWFPLTWISHMLDYQLYGPAPGMHHATNLILHTLNSLLLFWVLTRMTGTMWRSAMVALLFGLHPINVDTVAWIAQRKNLLSTFFFMGTLLAYSFYAEKPRFHMYLLSLLLFAFGLLSKPIIVTLPFLLLLLDYWPLKRMPIVATSAVVIPITDEPESSAPSLRDVLLEKIPFLILAMASVIISRILVQNDNILVTTEMRSIPLRVANALVSYAAYMGKMIWPFKLAVFYPFPETVPFWRASLAFLLLAGISLYAIRLVKQKPYLSVGWFWYIGVLFPFIGLVQAGLWPAMADRWAYLSFIGLFIGAVWGVGEWMGRMRRGKYSAWVLLALICFLLGSRTWNQLHYWRNSRTLFEHTLNLTENNYMIHNNLANALKDTNRLDEAKRHYLETLRINPGFLMARYNLGNLLKYQGNTKEAIAQYREVLRLDPEYAGAHNNLATALISMSRVEKLLTYCDDLPRERNTSSSESVHRHLKEALALTDTIDEAIFHFREKIRISPESDIATTNLARALALRIKVENAGKTLQRLLNDSVHGFR